MMGIPKVGMCCPYCGKNLNETRTGIRILLKERIEHRIKCEARKPFERGFNKAIDCVTEIARERRIK